MEWTALLLSLDCSTLPLIRTFYCWVLSKEVSCTIFKVFGMTRPGIEPRSTGPVPNTLPTGPMSWYNISILAIKYLFVSLMKSHIISVNNTDCIFTEIPCDLLFFFSCTTTKERKNNDLKKTLLHPTGCKLAEVIGILTLDETTCQIVCILIRKKVCLIFNYWKGHLTIVEINLILTGRYAINIFTFHSLSFILIFFYQ